MPKGRERRRMSKDIVEKRLEEYNDVFVDIVNNAVCKGKQVLREEDLEAMPTEAYTKIKGRYRQGNRDVYKVDKRKNYYRLYSNLENQTKVDNTMPERAMGYDYAGYEEQVRRIMEENRVAEKPAYAKRIHDGQKLAPVLSAVLFYGKKWTGPRRLYDMLEFPPEAAQILRELVPDYPLNLVEVRKLPPGVRQRFTSDFRLIAEFVACQNNPRELDKLLADNQFVIKHPEEFFDLLYEITSDRRFEKVKKALTREEKEGGITMCKGLDRLEKRGRKEGEKRFATLTDRLLKESRLEDLQKAINNIKYRTVLYQEYGL